MDTLQTQKEHFKTWFDKTIKEQSEIRQGLVGQEIDRVFYTPKVEGWDIDVKDQTVIHVPYGYLTFTTTAQNTYRINTDYQTWCGGIFGIMLEKIVTNETHNPATVALINYMLIDERWNKIKSAKIDQIDWNWKREPNCKLNGQCFTISEVQKYLLEDCFVPESLVFHFDKTKSISFFALEPDEELVDKQTYKLISGGEEIMIFFDEAKVRHWGITSIGLQVQAD